MRGSDKKKMIAAGILFPIAVVWLYLSFNPSSAPASTTPQQSKRQSALQTLTKGEPDGSRPPTGAPAKRQRVWSAGAAVDPTLRVDLIDKQRAVNYEGSERNIFQFYTPPVQAAATIPKPVTTPYGPQQPPPPPGPEQPKPAPTIPLKFYGVASAPGVSPKKAFLQEGEEIFIATEGEIVKKRYKVVKINDNNIEMEDTQYNSKQRIPLQES